MGSRTSSRLAEAQAQKLLIRFDREFEEGEVSGYVVEIGPAFFAVAVVEDGARFNGFLCPRLSDVRHLQVPHEYSRFVEKALKLSGRRRPEKPRIKIDSIEELLLSAQRNFPLVTIHREKVDPGVCWIGRVLKVDKGRVLFLKINPGAVWKRKPSEFKLTEITRVDFGGEYERALWLVGGRPPKQSLQPS